MGLYGTLKFIHVLAASAMVGGGLLFTMLLASAVLRRSREEILAVNAVGRWIGTRFFAPVLLLLLVFGIWAAIEGNFSFGDGWIIIGIVVLVISVILGPTVHERNARQLAAAIEEEGPESGRAFNAARRDLVVSIFELLLLIFAIWAMTTKAWL